MKISPYTQVYINYVLLKNGKLYPVGGENWGSTSRDIAVRRRENERLEYSERNPYWKSKKRWKTLRVVPVKYQNGGVYEY